MKISVVTAVRNDPEGIKTTLQTVACQANAEVEVEHIIIDGASTDTTSAVIDRLVAERGNASNPTYVVAHEADRGIYDAMNKGRRLASGDFAYFLNAGDELSSVNVFSGLAECIQLTGEGSALYYGQVRITSKYASWFRPEGLTELRQVSIENLRDLPHHQSAFYPRSFYVANDYDADFIKYGDTDFSLRAVDAVPCFFAPVLIATVTLGGFSTKRHSWTDARALRHDFARLRRKHPSRVSRGEAVLRSGSIVGKWLVDQLFGSDVKHLLMRCVRKKRCPRSQQSRSS